MSEYSTANGDVLQSAPYPYGPQSAVQASLPTGLAIGKSQRHASDVADLAD
jgi:hypothetical protein